MNADWAEQAGELVWMPERGCGYYPVSDTPYDAAYFEKLRSYRDSEIGRKLLKFRIAFTRRHLHWGPVCDVGIGDGAFVEGMMINATGFDVNPASLEWLHERGLYQDPYKGIRNVTCWDALEHMREPEKLLACIKDTLIVSLPIFRDADHVLRSKHFRKDEHYWYWTRAGFIRFLFEHNFEVIDSSTMESVIGRDEIETFAARRIHGN